MIYGLVGGVTQLGGDIRSGKLAELVSATSLVGTTYSNTEILQAAVIELWSFSVDGVSLAAAVAIFART